VLKIQFFFSLSPENFMLITLAANPAPGLEPTTELMTDYPSLALALALEKFSKPASQQSKEKRADKVLKICTYMIT
jgi:hypothetical protein